MTFLEGFASGFNDSYNRRKDREAEKENTMFKYQMEGLLKNKELRQKKKQEESQWASQAGDLAGQLGDTEASTMFYKELSNGVSYETLQKRVLENMYEKNNQFTKPTQTVKIPSGVSTASTLTEQTPETVESTSGGLKGIIETGKARKEAAMQSRVDKQIDELDPELRQYAQAEEDTSPSMDYSNSPYILKKNEYKIGDYADSLYKLRKAEAEGDVAAMEDAKLQVRVHQSILTEKAAREAEAQGKKGSRYFIKNDKGEISGIAFGERRFNEETGKEEIWNTSNPNNPVPLQGDIVTMDDKMSERYVSVVNDFGKKSADYNTATASFVAAIDSSQKIEEILRNNPDVAAGTIAGGVSLINRLEGEAKAAYSLLYDMEQNINAKVKSGDMEGIEQEVNKYVKQAESFSSSFMSQGMKDMALDKAKYDSLRVAVAYQYAVASGVSNGRMSNQDFENNYQRIGGDKPAIEVMKALQLTGQESFIRLDSVRNTLANEPQLKTFERDYGLKTGLAPARIGEQIMQLGIPEDRKKSLITYLGALNAQKEMGQDAAVQSANQSQQVEPDKQGPATITSEEEFNKLPSGATFIDPEGNIRRKP